MAQKQTNPHRRQKREYYYSILIMAAIPLLIVANTIILILSVRDDYQRQQYGEADVINSVFGSAIADGIENADYVQSVINRLVQENTEEEINQISVALVDENSANGSYIVTASSNQELVGADVDPNLTALAINNPAGIATNAVDDSGEQIRTVATPILQGDEAIAIIVTNFSLNDLNTLVSSIYNQSLFILMIVVAVVFLLLLNHFKFVNYSVLFRKLKEVDQLKNDFLSVATHELKSPMGVIKGSLENINDGIFGPVNDRMRESIDLALNETNRLSNLVTDLLNVSRIEQGRITYKAEPVNLQEILLHLTNQYRSKAQEKGLTLRYEPTDKNYIVTADHGRILEIFTNLVDNAIKYSDKGEIVVFHEVEKGKVRTIVRDNGIGMTGAEREKLFSRFYRVQNDKTAKISGTGLGLWIIKQYIEAMNGSIYVDSLKDVGSSFTVEFPLTAEKPAPGITGNPNQPSA